MLTSFAIMAEIAIDGKGFGSSLEPSGQDRAIAKDEAQNDQRGEAPEFKMDQQAGT
jgi:hypothetical protein